MIRIPRPYRKGLILFISLTSILLFSSTLVMFYPSLFINKPQPLGGQVLILTLNASGGHMSAAQALGESLKNRGIYSDILPIDQYCDPFSMFGLHYEQATRSSFGRLWINKILGPTYWLFLPVITHSLRVLLPEILDNYKCIVSVMPFLGTLFSYLEEFHTLPTILIPTDLHDPFVYFHWIPNFLATSPVMSHHPGYWLESKDAYGLYLLGSEKLVEQAKEIGLVNFKPISGMIIKKQFTDLQTSKVELQKKLGIPLGKKVVLFLFGSCGSIEMIKLIKIMQNSDYYCVFVCGKSKEIKRMLEKLDVDKKHRILGFIDNVPEWMKASDICVGKPGPGVISECIASNIPLVVKDGPDVMMQEKYNLEYIKGKKLGGLVRKWKELPALLEEMFRDYAQYQEAIAAIPKNNALEETCSLIQKIITTSEVF